VKSLIWTLVLTGVALNAVAQLLLKAATRIAGPLVDDQGQLGWQNSIVLLTTVPFWCGLACYGVSLVLWLGALSRAPVSVAYPMLSIGYVINAVAAAMLFGEALTSAKVAGIGLIIAGVVVLSRGV
jgi:multidrug transporter EmrE-like cation transporter